MNTISIGHIVWFWARDDDDEPTPLPAIVVRVFVPKLNVGPPRLELHVLYAMDKCGGAVEKRQRAVSFGPGEPGCWGLRGQAPPDSVRGRALADRA